MQKLLPLTAFSLLLLITLVYQPVFADDDFGLRQKIFSKLVEFLRDIRNDIIELQEQVAKLFEITAPVQEFNERSGGDSFFDIFVDLGTHNEDIARLEAAIENLRGQTDTTHSSSLGVAQYVPRSSASFVSQNTITLTADLLSDCDDNSCVFEQTRIFKDIDSASPLLAQIIAQGEKFDEIMIGWQYFDSLPSSAAGYSNDALRITGYKLIDVEIISMSLTSEPPAVVNGLLLPAVQKNSVPIEEIALNFAKVEIISTLFDLDGNIVDNTCIILNDRTRSTIATQVAGCTDSFTITFVGLE